MYLFILCGYSILCLIAILIMSVSPKYKHNRNIYYNLCKNLIFFFVDDTFKKLLNDKLL